MGELAALRVDRVDFLRGSLGVVEAVTEVNGRLAVGPTKTGARRSVSLPRFLVELLRSHVANHPSPCGLVFSSVEGTLLGRNFYRRHFKPAHAGLRGVGVGDLVLKIASMSTTTTRS